MAELNSKFVRPIADVIAELEEEIVEATIEGEYDEAERLTVRVADMRERMELGELYECMF